MANISTKARLYVSLLVMSVIILLSLSIVFYGFYQVYFAPASLFSADFSDGSAVEDFFDDKVVNVALLGMHNRNEDNTFGEIYYIDTILIASINFDLDALILLAVPRDSYVTIAHTGVKDRIRQSYSYGYSSMADEDRHQKGLRFAVDTVSTALDILKLHYHVAMDMEGLKQLIDSMGGVYYEVETDMIGFTAQESLLAGPQILDGRGYLNYLTYREADARDDLNRMERQKKLLLSTFDYFQQKGLFSYIIPLYSTYREHIDTDLSFNQIAALALFAAERLEADAIYDYSLQGNYFTLDDGLNYYLAIDQTEKKQLLKKLSGGRAD